MVMRKSNLRIIGAVAILLVASTALIAVNIGDRDHDLLDVMDRKLAVTDAENEYYPKRRAHHSIRLRELEKAKADAIPVEICGRLPPFPPQHDLELARDYTKCPQNTTNEDPLLLLHGYNPYGRTGNNFIEFMRALQYARENPSTVVGIMKESWAVNLITSMWFPIQDGRYDEWKARVEDAFCVKIISGEEELSQYKNILDMDTKDLYFSQSNTSIEDYVQYLGYVLRNLFRDYVKGEGHDGRGEPVKDMCSVVNTLFNDETSSVKYSVIHSRYQEGVGEGILSIISRKSGCDPHAALNMEPDYVKSILRDADMLDEKIVIITDHQRPEVLERLLADPEIGHNILLPKEESWIGGDLTVAIAADVFIGSPASTFSGFIAKSRLALGFNRNYLFRSKNSAGEWFDVCSEQCIFDKKVMRWLY